MIYKIDGSGVTNPQTGGELDELVIDSINDLGGEFQVVVNLYETLTAAENGLQPVYTGAFSVWCESEEDAIAAIPDVTRIMTKDAGALDVDFSNATLR